MVRMTVGYRAHANLLTVRLRNIPTERKFRPPSAHFRLPVST